MTPDNAAPLSAEQFEKFAARSDLSVMERLLITAVRDRERQRDEAVKETNRFVEQDLANLREDRDELQRQYDAEIKDHYKDVKLLADKYQELQRQLAEGRKDTERLDWLAARQRGVRHSGQQEGVAVTTERAIEKARALMDGLHASAQTFTDPAEDAWGEFEKRTIAAELLLAYANGMERGAEIMPVALANLAFLRTEQERIRAEAAKLRDE